MDPRASSDETGQVSALIGAIYDCAIDPSRWERTLDEIRELLDCTNCVLSVVNLDDASYRIQWMLGIDPAWVARMAEYAPELLELYGQVPDLHDLPIDQPVSPCWMLGVEAVRTNGYYLKWAKPQGLIDSIAVALMRTPSRRGELSFGRREEVGVITAREIRLLGMLAPHIRRAVTITDLIDMKDLAAGALAETLDAVAAGVVLVDGDGGIVHANRPAERMMRHGHPIRAVRGRLSAAEADASEHLRQVIDLAVHRDGEIGADGIGLALMAEGNPAAVAHVLPLSGGEVRMRLMPRACAAVFVSPGVEPARGGIDAFAKGWGLTRAETRLLRRLARGQSLAEAASSLDIGLTTAKTHLSRILDKTGSRRQADLIGRVHRMVPPVAGRKD